MTLYTFIAIIGIALAFCVFSTCFLVAQNASTANEELERKEREKNMRFIVIMVAYLKRVIREERRQLAEEINRKRLEDLEKLK